MRVVASKRGQTTIEYLLLVGVLLVIILSLFPLLRDRFIGDGNCSASGNQTLFCRLIASLNLDGGVQGTYRYFKLRR